MPFRWSACNRTWKIAATPPAAGVAAALAAQLDGAVRSIEIQQMQQHLVSIGCLEPGVLSHQDSLLIAESQIAEVDAAEGFDAGFEHIHWAGATSRWSRLDIVILAMGSTGDRRRWSRC